MPMTIRTVAVKCAIYALYCTIVSASPLRSIVGPGSTGNAGGPGCPGEIVAPHSVATTISNVVANTDIAPEVNVAPTIPVPFSVLYSVPVPVAAAYPYPFPSCFCKRSRDDMNA
ncbi:MAG: hypothetical protein J3Q66DRAFT_363561 [Benniella sp.]|nr:MAG: hypothetical protein J3Q66DRAFT_363561 [Benniella sp.]